MAHLPPCRSRAISMNLRTSSAVTSLSFGWPAPPAKKWSRFDVEDFCPVPQLCFQCGFAPSVVGFFSGVGVGSGVGLIDRDSRRSFFGSRHRYCLRPIRAFRQWTVCVILLRASSDSHHAPARPFRDQSSPRENREEGHSGKARRADGLTLALHPKDRGWRDEHFDHNCSRVEQSPGLLP